MTDEAEKAYEAQIEAMAKAAFAFQARNTDFAGIFLKWETMDDAVKLAWVQLQRAAAEPIGLKPGCVVVPATATDEMLEAALDATGERAVAYVAPRECGVPVDCDISEDDARSFNDEGKKGHAATYAAMIAAALPRQPEKEGSK